MALLEIQDLAVGFNTEAGFVHAVDGVSLRLDSARTLGLVGESGCGKSVAASSILRLVPSPPGKITGGSSFSAAPTFWNCLPRICRISAARTSR